MSSKPTAKLALKHNKKLDKIYDPITGLVFKSPNEKLVTGRIVDNEFRPLDEEILALCEEHGFKHDESLIEVAEEGDAPTTETEEEPQEVASPATTPTPATAPVVVPVSVPTPATVSTPAVPPVPASSQTLASSQPSIAPLLKEIENMFLASQAKLAELADVKNQLATARKDLDETKRKLKAVLSSLQENL